MSIRYSRMFDVPVFTRHQDGVVTIEWPDPPSAAYPVAGEVIQGWVDFYNSRRARDEAIILATIEWGGHPCLDPVTGPDFDEIIVLAERRKL